MFEGFATSRVDAGEVEIHVRHGGKGPSLLLLHGYPETHVIWHKVAAALAERFTVVAPDLPGAISCLRRRRPIRWPNSSPFWPPEPMKGT